MLAPDEWFNTQFKIKGDIFDKSSFDMCIRHTTKFNEVIDVGAHVGSWSIGFSKLFKKVFAFEADQTNFSFLGKNIEAHKSNNIQTFYTAIGETQKQVSIQKGTQNSGQSHVCNGNSVEMKKIDDFIELFNNINLIKIDVEGYEYNAILGAKETILKFAPLIMIEVNGLSEQYYNIPKEKIFGLLKEFGYSQIDYKNKDSLWKKNV